VVTPTFSSCLKSSFGRKVSPFTKFHFVSGIDPPRFHIPRPEQANALATPCHTLQLWTRSNVFLANWLNYSMRIRRNMTKWGSGKKLLTWFSIWWYQPGGVSGQTAIKSKRSKSKSGYCTINLSDVYHPKVCKGLATSVPRELEVDLLFSDLRWSKMI